MDFDTMPDVASLAHAVLEQHRDWMTEPDVAYRLVIQLAKLTGHRYFRLDARPGHPVLTAITTSTLILQLCIRPLVSFVVGECGSVMVLSSPYRPFEDEGLCGPLPDQQVGKEGADFRQDGHEPRHEGQAAILEFGLVSFGLFQATRLRSAVSFARNAAAAMSGRPSVCSGAARKTKRT
ncbi:hypothetical protein [Lichenifustis flavocetrariae]|uniref:Uncharacterized protein n=1 Tax=Lichenifustis flavocetrariae TaxID=2949735 RepID=A0AA41Z624_9HYPH|nr:hypothetical protein [Lichenifustis flavocetrariae]MCW6511168.1 hypothetical protein [Lichenifustis flavocetrariae]